MNENANSKINVFIYCVQPVRLEENLYKGILTSILDKKNLASFSNQGFQLRWLEEFNEKNNVYDYIKSIKNDKQLIAERNLKSESFAKAPEDIRNLLLNCSVLFKYELLFDIRFSYFIVVYELQLGVTEKVVDKYFKEKKYNLYQYFRKLFVKETDESELPQWQQKIRSEIRNKILQIIKQCYTIANVSTENIDFMNNTGNITLFIQTNNVSKFKYQWIALNEEAERLKIKIKPILEENDIVYTFNGRFHTILIKSLDNQMRYMPIQFHMQYMWFIMKYYGNILDKLNIELMQKKDTNSLIEMNNILDEFINKIQLLNIHNEKFIVAIEIDNEYVFKKIENKWNILGNIKNLKEYISFFKDYSEKIYAKKMEQIQKKQNKILFFISFLQIAALISVWNDYLSLLNEKNIENVDEILFLFDGSAKNLIVFNEYIPLVLLCISIAIWIYLFFRQKK